VTQSPTRQAATASTFGPQQIGPAPEHVMRSSLLSCLTVLGIGLASAAMATQPAALSATGTIKSIDAKAHSVTLSDGHSYLLPAHLKAKALKVGEAVTVVYTQSGKVDTASKITPTKN
jgi:Cu/Ag efflux protein CusF